MAFFDKLNDLAKNITEKTTDAIEITKLNSRANSEKNAAGEELKKIGKFYYSQYVDGKEIAPEILGFCDAAKAHYDAAAQAQAEIDRIKTEDDPPTPSSAGTAAPASAPAAAPASAPIVQDAQEPAAETEFADRLQESPDTVLEVEPTPAVSDFAAESAPEAVLESEPAVSSEPAFESELAPAPQADLTSEPEPQENVPQELFCKVCGKKIIPGKKFCGECGTKVE